jgi:uncharacterized membrane protein YgcG
MKLIGGQIVEQHIEKIVLAAAMVIFLLVLAMQFLYEPNLVKVGNGPPQPPDKAFVQVEREARTLDGKLRSAKTPELDEEAKQRLQQTLSRLEGFDRALASAVSPRPVLGASMGKVAHVEGGESTEKLTGNPVAMVSVPAPAATVAYTHRATIDPREVIDHPELRQVLPPEQPYDMTAVSVGVVFDGMALRAKLMEDPDGAEGEVRPMPSVWWRNATEILAVEGEREELGSDGRWTNRISLDPMPGREQVVGKIDEDVKRFEDIAPVVAEAQMRKKEIQRPSFYKQIAGPEWVEPADAVVGGELDETQLEINKLLDKIKTVKLTIRRTEKAIELAGQRERDTANRPTGGGRGGEGGGGGKGSGGGRVGGGSGRKKDTSKDKQRSKIATLERKIEQLNVQLQDLMDQARELGHVFEADRMAGRMPIDEPDPSDYLPLFENDQVKLWMHDLKIEPGKTYRYRMRVVLNNPAFGRQAYLIDDQKSLAEKPTLAGEWSEWTEPVEVLPDTCFFVTSANEGTGLSGPRANVSMYKFYYGYWREASSMLEPGDTLLAQAKLPEKGLWIWDEKKLAEGDEEKQDRGPRGGGGGRGVIPPERGGGRGVAPGVGRGRDVPPVRKDEPENPEDEVPEGAEPGPKALELSLDLFLLDVARVPGEGGRGGSLGTSSRARYQAFLGGAPGGILRRLPAEDKATSLYQLVKASADLGRTQGATKLQEAEEEEDVYIPGMRSPRDDQSDAGGGGTGGG